MVPFALCFRPVLQLLSIAGLRGAALTEVAEGDPGEEEGEDHPPVRHAVLDHQVLDDKIGEAVEQADDLAPVGPFEMEAGARSVSQLC